MDQTKIVPADLDSPHRELSNGGLGIVVALLVRRGIDFSCASTGDPIQLYLFLRTKLVIDMTAKELFQPLTMDIIMILLKS